MVGPNSHLMSWAAKVTLMRVPRYTADEPDGWVDPLNGTTNAYDLIYSLDGYHPVSLVLNCQNYHFDAYTAGTDIVMQDTYMIGNNVTFSNQWGYVILNGNLQPCTELTEEIF